MSEVLVILSAYKQLARCLKEPSVLVPSINCDVGEPCHKNNAIPQHSCSVLVPVCPLVVSPTLLIEAEE